LAAVPRFTPGTVTDAAVVKLHAIGFANGNPDTFLAPVVTVALYKVFGRKALDGVNDAVDPVYVTAPATGVVPCKTVKVVELIVD
jgi:hypothetical protein